VSPLHLALETVNDYADLFLGWPHAEGLTSHASAQPDGDGFLVQRSDGRQLTVGASGQVNHSIGSPRVPRVEAILGVRKWTLVDATSEEMHGVLADLKWNVAEHDEVELVVRRAAISFYREHALYEVLSRRKATMAFQQYYFLHHPGGIVRPLDGKSQPIHETNNDERPTFAGDEDAADYLRFFCWATRADEGRFLIVERFRDIPWEKAIDKNDRQKVLRNLKPVSVAPAAANAGKGTTWSGSASVSYGRALFVALFSISPNGRVDMTDDTPVVGELPVREFQPGKLTIERTLTGHGEPETYLDTYPTASQQPNGSLVECRPEQFLKQIEARHADPSR